MLLASRALADDGLESVYVWVGLANKKSACGRRGGKRGDEYVSVSVVWCVGLCVGKRACDQRRKSCVCVGLACLGGKNEQDHLFIIHVDGFQVVAKFVVWEEAFLLLMCKWFVWVCGCGCVMCEMRWTLI